MVTDIITILLIGLALGLYILDIFSKKNKELKFRITTSSLRVICITIATVIVFFDVLVGIFTLDFQNTRFVLLFGLPIWCAFEGFMQHKLILSETKKDETKRVD